MHHFHNYIAIPAAYDKKKKSGLIFDPDSFDAGIYSMALANISPQKCHFDNYEKILIRQCVEISRDSTIKERRTLRRW